MRKNKILLLFPDGVGIRNYLYSDVFKNTEAELILFHNFDDETIADIKKQTELSQTFQIPKYTETLREKFLRELICLSRLYSNSKKTRNPSILTNWNRNHKSLSKKIFYKAIEIIAPFIKKYDAILSLESFYQKAIRTTAFYKEVKEILEKLNPDMLFCSHQRALQAATIFAAASDLGIETSTVIYSWDNLPKARMALRADNYLVWSDYMKSEMELYYPEISLDAIHITGTPQFEFYKQSERIISREDFALRYGLNKEKKWILYSGDDILTSPYDQDYLKDVAKSLLEIEEKDRPELIFRRCPVDFSERYDEVLNEFNALIFSINPEWNVSVNGWVNYFPKVKDINLLVNLVYHCEFVINIASTMAHDFAVYNKPCIYINYNHDHVINWSVKTVYQFQHFKSMDDLKPVIWLDDRGSWSDTILKIIKNQFQDSDCRKKWLEKIVLHPIEKNSDMIASILKKKEL